MVVLASLAFYAWWDVRFVPLLAGLTVANWLVAQWFGVWRARWIPVLGVVLNLGVLGLFKYAAHFAGPVWWLAPMMIPIEIISHMARPLSLTFRLYGNMFAGEQVTGVFLRLTYLILPAVFMGLHVFVSFLQAYIFTFLSALFIGSAIHPH